MRKPMCAGGVGFALKRLCAVCGAALLLASCATWQSGGPTPGSESASRPEWRAGDHWMFSWTAGDQRGLKAVDVAFLQEVHGARYYVLNTGTLQHYYTIDLQWAWAVNPADSRVIARAVPAQPYFVWPLEVGKSWNHRGVLEGQGKRESLNETYRVAAFERVEVPVGSFRAFRIIRDAGSQGSDEYWYAPEVHWYVKWIGRRGNEGFQEVLQEYTPAPLAEGAARSVPAAPVSRPRP
jgi:hypothetical protein